MGIKPLVELSVIWMARSLWKMPTIQEILWGPTILAAYWASSSLGVVPMWKGHIARVRWMLLHGIDKGLSVHMINAIPMIAGTLFLKMFFTWIRPREQLIRLLSRCLRISLKMAPRPISCATTPIIMPMELCGDKTWVQIRIRFSRMPLRG